MGWPTPQDYNEAIQNPQLCFQDPALRRGSVELNALGLPRPNSGAFATVYKVNCTDGAWAVRCFMREYVDQQARYAAISAYLNQLQFPFMVRFEFISDGILIKGKWYPILKMEWIEGESLESYVRENLSQPQKLDTIRKQFLELLKALHSQRVAHGDLQHGNILVSAGNLKLIDYDGMYVPALANSKSNEEGHRNYQSPLRSGSDFGPHLDAFSGWIIYLSLHALACEPGLWKTLNGGDECLLFRREDFLASHRSPAFQRLRECPHAELRLLTSELESLVACPLRLIPPVSTLSAELTKMAGPTGGVPDWMAPPAANATKPGSSMTLPGLNTAVPGSSTPSSSKLQVPGGQVSKTPSASLRQSDAHVPVEPPSQRIDLFDATDIAIQRIGLVIACMAVSTIIGTMVLGFVQVHLGIITMVLIYGFVIIMLSSSYYYLPAHGQRSKFQKLAAAVQQELDTVQQEQNVLQSQSESLLRALNDLQTALHAQQQLAHQRTQSGDPQARESHAEAVRLQREYETQRSATELELDRLRRHAGRK